MVAPDDCPSQAEYIKYFDDAIAVMQTEAALERIAYELCVDSAAENVDYLEVRWAPRLHMRHGLAIEQVDSFNACSVDQAFPQEPAEAGRDDSRGHSRVAGLPGVGNGENPSPAPIRLHIGAGAISTLGGYDIPDALR